MSRRAYRLTVAGCLAVLVSYLVLTPDLAGLQRIPDFGAFYAVARALRLHGLGALPHLYSLHFQLRAGTFFGRVGGKPYVEPFVDTPLAALVVIPFTWLPFWPAFYLWDAVLLGLALAGALWLARGEGLGAQSLPLALVVVASFPTYVALGEGQYDLLWPLALALLASAWRRRPGWPRVARNLLGVVICSFKPDLLLAAVVPGVHRIRDRRLQELLLCVLAVAAVSLAAIGVSGLRALTSLESFTLYHRFPPTLDVTLLGVLWHTVGHHSLTIQLAWAGTALGILALAWAWLRRPPQGPVEWRLCLCSTLCLSLLLAPHNLGYGLLLLSGPAIWMASALRQAGRGLGWFWAWVALFNAGGIIDASPHIHLPFPITPVLLLLGALTAWRARDLLQRAPASARSEPLPAPTSP
ncbi:MAG: glycosyltransferase 87 family protein [Candidatus Dormibacteria bacterium]